MNLDPAALAARWAKDLPRDFARRLAQALRAGPAELGVLQAATAAPESRAAIGRAIALTKQGDGPYTAGLLAGRLATQEEQPHLQTVWTGPTSTAGHQRLTLAVVADLIDEAKFEILLVSYAALPGQTVRDALHTAVARGVAITLLLERSSDNHKFTGGDDPFPGLTATRLHWPSAARPSGASMHAKLLVIDRRLALVGSANITGHALERNLECGVLVRGGGLPGQICDYLTQVQGLGAS